MVDILVVEDEAIVAKDIAECLARAGYRVVGTASTASRAVELAATQRPDLVLMDIVLQGDHDGIHAAEHIQGELAIPVVYLTAYSDEGTLDRAKHMGAFGYILKPFDERELRTTIEMALFKSRMERRLRESERTLSITLQSIADAVIATDAAGAVALMNPAAEALCGWSLREARGLDLARVFDVVDASGAPLPVHPVERVLREGAPAAVEEGFRLTTKDGRLLEVGDSIAPVRDERGRVEGSVLVFRDVSERRRLEERLREAHKMEALGRLAGGIAHDFNNLLTVVLANAELMLRPRATGAEIQAGLLEIKAAVQRGAGLTQQLLAFSRRQLLEPRVIDVNQVVTAMVGMLERLIGEDVRLERALAPEPIHVRADRSQLEQVLLNLVVNARDAMPRGGTVRVETACVELDATAARQRGVAGPGPYVALTVADTGVGMAPETLARVFEPFFSTKEPGKGTGLGLATVYGICEQSGGRVLAESALGGGSTFTVLLPRVDEPAGEVAGDGAGHAPARRGEMVLLVEDDDRVRDLLSRVLREEGYQVLTAGHGEEGLRLAGVHPGPIDLLITDTVMPGMGGAELAARFVGVRPRAPVLFISGHAEDALARQGAVPDGSSFLAKPVSSDALTARVRELLDRRR